MGFLLSHGQRWLSHPQPNELKPYYILPEGYRARPPEPELQLEDTVAILADSSQVAGIPSRTVPYRAYRSKEDLDGLPSPWYGCV